MEECSFGLIRFLPGDNRVRYPFCHSLYIEGAGILIDPASNRERFIRLRAEEGVKMVWLRHWHEDHFMHLDLFDDLPLWISAGDAPPLADLEVLMKWYELDQEEKNSESPCFVNSSIFGRGALQVTSGAGKPSAWITFQKRGIILSENGRYRKRDNGWKL